MPEESLPDESVNTAWIPPLDLDEQTVGAAPVDQPAVGQQLSRLALAAAGTAALNILLTLACIALWMMDDQMVLTGIASSNGLWILFGLAAVGLGGFIQRNQKRAGIKGGTEAVIATTAILSGSLIMSVAVMLPLISAMRNMLGSVP